MLRCRAAGESHGEALAALIEGVPAGVAENCSTSHVNDMIKSHG